MSAFKDSDKGTWISQFYYTDLEGIKRRKRKRGFRLKRDALAFEKEFLKSNDFNELTFDYYAELYLDDIKYRIKLSSYEQKKYLIENKITPFFHNKIMSQIKPRDIRNWQNTLLAQVKKNGKPYSPTYLKSIYTQLNAIFNFCVRFYELKENPCIKAGNFGSSKGKERSIWTIEDYYKFQDEIQKLNPVHSLAIEVLYFTGIRVGELLALTPEDIDPINNIISINKTFRKQKGQEIFTLPKTKKSKRDIAVPTTLIRKVLRYISSLEKDINLNQRIFPFTAAALNYSIKKYAPKAKIPVIRIHDLRHSHVSLLINMGFDVSVIADRMGHEKIETTLGIYTHIYPDGRKEVSNQLEALLSDTDSLEFEETKTNNPKTFSKNLRILS